MFGWAALSVVLFCTGFVFINGIIIPSLPEALKTKLNSSPVVEDGDLSEGETDLSSWMTSVKPPHWHRLHPFRRNIVSYLAKSHPDSGCYCFNDTCACCRRVVIEKFNINDTGCAEIIYLPEEIGLSLIFAIDDFVWINKTVSVHNPPPICYAVPKISAADVCLQFHHLDYKNNTLSGCVRIKAELVNVDIYERELGCFRFPNPAGQYTNEYTKTETKPYGLLESHKWTKLLEEPV